MLPYDFTCDGRSYRLEQAPRAPRTPDGRGFELVPVVERTALVRQWWALGPRRVVAELHALVHGREPSSSPPDDADALPERLIERLCGPEASLVLLRRMPLPIQRDPVPSIDDAEPLVTGDEDDDAVTDVDHWLELSFVDAEGVPMAGIACTVELPNGMLRSARSNDAGIVRVEDIARPGRCIVTFDGPAVAGLGGPTTAAPPPPEPVGPADRTFTVTLVDEIGEPIAGAELRFTGITATSAITDDQGKVELPDEAAPTGYVEVDHEALKDELRARWDAIRPGDHVEDGDGSTVRMFGDPKPVLLFADEPHVISIQPRVDRLVAKGLLFETSKAFLLPTALPAMRTVVEHYARLPDARVLVVGHTDQAGSTQYNATLSCERAAAMAAFLGDDVDAWLPFYGPSMSWEKRWGAPEDALMLAALPDFASRPPGASAVRWFQETRGLAVDGVAGPETRRALIGEYMATDGTSLPAGASVTTHGCGESFPELRLADGTPAQENRRVELFFFRPDLGVQPPPPGPTSSPSDPQYPEWVRRALNTLEEDVEDLLESLSWSEGPAEGAAGLTFLIRHVDEEKSEQRSAAAERHDLSDLGNELRVELGLHHEGDLAPLRHRHRVDVGKLRAALRLGDPAMLREALAVVVQGEAPQPLPPGEPIPWEGEPVSIEKPPGDL
jgi:outer membrane protein OmpA-like peptidoglycan-associated protein